MYAKGCASIACLMALLVPASAGRTDTFELPLDGLLGHYTTDASAGVLGKTCAYDCGTAFLEVQEVRIRIAGTFYGGLWEPESPFGVLLDGVTAPGFYSVLYPEAVGPGVSVVALDCSGAFDVEAVYDHISILDWERVKQGWGEVSLGINAPLFLDPEDPYELVEHATGDVTQATLIFEGTPVPAPAVMALLGMGALAVARRRKPAGPGRSR